MGHGFKAAACVWQARRTNATKHPAWGPTSAYKQRPKEEITQMFGELLVARDLTPAARAQLAELLAAVSSMEHDKAQASTVGKAKLSAGAACPRAAGGTAPTPPASGQTKAVGQPAIVPSGKCQTTGAEVAVLCTEPGMPALPASVGVA